MSGANQKPCKSPDCRSPVSYSRATGTSKATLLPRTRQGYYLRAWAGVVSEVQSCRVVDSARWREGPVDGATPSYGDAGSSDRTSVVGDSEPTWIRSSEEDSRDHHRSCPRIGEGDGLHRAGSVDRLRDERNRGR